MSATETTALTLPERAAVALGTAKHEKELILLVAESKTITEIKNADARTQCHAAYMKLKNARVAIKATGESAREDATAFSKAVIAEENRLIAIAAPEEKRLQTIRDKWDADREAERQAKIKAEQERVAKIQAAIEHIRSIPTFTVGKSAAAIQATIDELSVDKYTECEFEDFLPKVQEVRAAALVQLQGILNAAIQAEAEAARIQAEREELAKLRAEAEARRAEAEAKAKAEQEAAQAEIAAQRAELERQQQEVARQQAILNAPTMAHADGINKDVAPRALEALTEQPSDDGFVPDETWPFHSMGTAAPAVPIVTPPTLRLGVIAERLGFAVSAELLRELGIEPADHAGRAVLFHEHQFPGICNALIAKVSRALAAHRMAEAA